MICIVDKKNQIINIVNADIITADNERQHYPWNRLWEQYTDVEPFDYAKNRYINAAGAEFAKRRDAIRFLDVDGVTYGFDCASDDITNFMAAYTPLLFAGKGTVFYKVWLTDSTKGIVELNAEQMTAVYADVRSGQMAAYAWYEEVKARIEAATTVEELNSIDVEVVK
jgi:hypothetical protein